MLMTVIVAMYSDDIVDTDVVVVGRFPMCLYNSEVWFVWSQHPGCD